MAEFSVGRELRRIAKDHAHMPDYRNPSKLNPSQRNTFRLKYPARAAKPKWKSRSEEADWRDELIEAIVEGVVTGSVKALVVPPGLDVGMSVMKKQLRGKKPWTGKVSGGAF